MIGTQWFLLLNNIKNCRYIIIRVVESTCSSGFLLVATELLSFMTTAPLVALGRCKSREVGQELVLGIEAGTMLLTAIVTVVGISLDLRAAK